MSETQLYSQKPSEPKPEPEPREVELCDTYYSTDDSAEYLEYDDDGEAIDAKLQNLDLDEWPDELQVYRWKRKDTTGDEALKKRLASRVLEQFLEELDDNEGFGDPNKVTKPTDAMRELAEIYVDSSLKLYRPWHCDRDPSGDQTINVALWVRVTWSDWDEDPKRKAWVEERISDPCPDVGK